MKKFYCANCGEEIDNEIGAFMFQDNFLIIKYFDDYKSNRFCCRKCACEALMGTFVSIEELPIDDDEISEEEERKND